MTRRAASGPQVLAVNVVRRVTRGAGRSTAIDKGPVAAPVAVGVLGIGSDTQCARFHGGPDKALYAFAVEEAAWWAADLGREVPPGLFGENLTTAGLAVDDAVIGELWQLGEPGSGVLVEVRLPRDACRNLSAYLGIPGFHRRFDQRGRPGAYLAVREPGRLAAGDPVRVVERPGHGVTVADLAAGATPQMLRALHESGLDLAPPLRRKVDRSARAARSS